MVSFTVVRLLAINISELPHEKFTKSLVLTYFSLKTVCVVEREIYFLELAQCWNSQLNEIATKFSKSKS